MIDRSINGLGSQTLFNLCAADAWLHHCCSTTRLRPQSQRTGHVRRKRRLALVQERKLNGEEPQGRLEICRRDSHDGAQAGWARYVASDDSTRSMQPFLCESPRASQAYMSMWRALKALSFVHSSTMRLELEVLAAKDCGGSRALAPRRASRSSKSAKTTSAR